MGLRTFDPWLTVVAADYSGLGLDRYGYRQYRYILPANIFADTTYIYTNTDIFILENINRYIGPTQYWSSGGLYTSR